MTEEEATGMSKLLPILQFNLGVWPSSVVVSSPSSPAVVVSPPSSPAIVMSPPSSPAVLHLSLPAVSSPSSPAVLSPLSHSLVASEDVRNFSI